MLESENGCSNHMTQSVEEKRVGLATIESERHFVQIGREMLRADAMPRSDDAALEQRECGFDRVRGHHEAVLVADVFFRFVINGLALRSLRDGQPLVVQHRFIGHDHVHIFAHVLLQDFADRLGVCVSNVDELQFAAALDDADDGFLVIPIVASADTLPLSADVRFINFNSAVQHLVNFRHGEANSVAEIPCRFVADPERALDLIRTHALLSFAEQERSEKPLLQSQMAVIENRTGCDGELVITALAVKQLPCRGKLDCFHVASWALDTIGPAETDKQLPAALIGIKHLDYVN